MYNTKLIQFLKLLNAVELKRLLQFLKSPFYNANPHIVKLYLHLRKEHPAYSSPKLTHEHIFKKLFPNRAYDHQKLLNLMSDFVTLLKQYLQLLQLEKEEQSQDQLLLRAYAERPMAYGLFEKQFSRAAKDLEEVSFRNGDFYRQKFQLYQSYFSHPATDPFQVSKEQYDEAMKCLDRGFLLEKLLLSCEMKAREKPLAENYDVWLLQEIREGINRYPIESPIAKTYVEMLDLLENEHAPSYFRLKDLLWDYQDQFTQKQQRNILQSLINFAIREGNQGAMGFVKENLKLYQFGLATGLFLKHGIFNDMTYISIVNIAIRSGELHWCEQFIEEYSPLLDKGTQLDAKVLARALWMYANEQHQEVISSLQQIEFLNVYYQVQARALLLKVYVELFRQDDSYLDLVVSRSDAFERFLRREKTIANAQKKALINFAQKIRQLAKLKLTPNGDRNKMAGLRQEVEGLSTLYNKTWLLRQLDR